MSSTKHRTTGDPTADLTPEQRADITQRCLAREVGNACDAWLRSRGIGPGKLFTYTAPVQRAGDPVAAQHDGTLRGGSKT